MKKFKIIVLALIIIFILIIGVRYFNQYRNTQVTLNYLKKFTPIPGLNTFKESQQRVYFGAKKYQQAVLLIHGYSSSPSEFNALTPYLRQSQVPYLAPQILGFGLGGLHLLYVVKSSDWKRQVLNAYDVLAATAKRVSVVGISNGGALAIYIAEHRHVDHLILVGPNAFNHPNDNFIKSLLQTPVIGPIFQWLHPVFVKPIREGRITNVDVLNEQYALSLFQTPALPINSLMTTWALQDQININKMHYKTLNILYGKHDITVDIKTFLAKLKANNLPHRSKRYTNTAHDPLADNDRVQASRDITCILTDNKMDFCSKRVIGEHQNES